MCLSNYLIGQAPESHSMSKRSSPTLSENFISVIFFMSIFLFSCEKEIDVDLFYESIKDGIKFITEEQRSIINYYKNNKKDIKPLQKDNFIVQKSSRIFKIFVQNCHSTLHEVEVIKLRISPSDT